MMSDPQPPPVSQPNVSQQLENILQTEQPKQPAPPKYQGVHGFNTQSFGQAWQQMITPGSEQKMSLPTPMSISSRPPQD
jgi:hypothetical protein